MRQVKGTVRMKTIVCWDYGALSFSKWSLLVCLHHLFNSFLKTFFTVFRKQSMILEEDIPQRQGLGNLLSSKPMQIATSSV